MYVVVGVISATTRVSNAVLVNFAAGETSPRSRGRFDLQWFLSSCRKLLNFIPEVAGPARFRPGFKRAAETHSGAVARLIPFQLNSVQGYLLEFSSGKMRAYRDGELLTWAGAPTITAITKANPGILSVSGGTPLAAGDVVILSGIVGMIELNGRHVRLSGAGPFSMLDPITGVAINTTSFTTYISGGTAAKVFELTSPYLAGELADISWAQEKNVMYLAHPRYAPRKLTLDSSPIFTLGTYARTNDPFVVVLSALTITAIERGVTTRVSFTAGDSFSEDVIYTFAGIVGTVQLNGGTYYLEISYDLGGPPRAFLKTAAGAHVDSTTWTNYVSGGTATASVDNPIAVAFYEGRLGFFGTNQRPNTFFLSRSPNTATGASRFDDFTGGSNPDDACFFTMVPINGQVAAIAWASGTPKHLIIGTFGGPHRVSGGGLDEPITPSSINVRPLDSFGCEAIAPAQGERTFYLQRGGVTVRAIQFNVDADDFKSYDMCLNAEHIASSRLQRVVLQTGRPDILWILREDGILAGMTVQGAENVAGWHRHKIGGANAKIIDVAVLSRSDQNDQLYVVTERTVGGVTRRAVEYLADDVTFPDLEDFYTDADSADDDEEAFWDAVYRLQERYIHVDAAATYDGSDRGVTASATLTPGAVTGTGIAFTASAAVFVAADVGNEIWKKPDPATGVGGGRAVITAVNGPGTIATCTVLVDFNSVSAIAAGNWHIAAETITGLWPLEGQTVSVQIDGAVYSDGLGGDEYPVVTVANGKITLSDPAAVVHVGLPYEGLLVSQNLEMGGSSGPAQSKPRNIVKMFIRFLNTLGCDFGTDPYQLAKVHHRSNEFITSRPSPVFSGIRDLPYSDRWSAEGEKHVVVSQRLPLPCVVQFLDLHYETADE